MVAAMNKSYTLQSLVLFFSLFNQPLFGKRAIGNLTLEQAKQLALEQNFTIRSSRERLNAANARIKIARSHNYPKLGITSGLNSFGDDISKMAPLGYGYLNYNLFNGFRDSIRSNVASIEANRIRLELEKIAFNVGLDVETFFHSYIFNRELLALQQQAITLNQSHLKLVQKSKSRGISSRSDLMEFELKGALLSSDMEIIHQKLEEARIGLLKLLGKDLSSNIDPVGEIHHQHITGQLIDYISRTKTHSYPVKLAGFDLKLSQEKYKLARSSWWPTLDFEIQAGRLPLESRGNSRDFQISFLLSVKFELFSGFSSTGQAEEKSALVASHDYTAQESILESTAKMETYFRRLKTIEKRVDLEHINIKRSQSYYDEVKKEYTRGYKDAADLSRAAEAVFRSQERQIQFMYSFLIERIKLERSLGTKVEVEYVNS